MPPTPKGTGKPKVSTSSAKQALVLDSKNNVKLPSASYKIVADVHEKDLCNPGGKSLTEDPGRAWTDPDWYTDLKDRMEFEAEYAHLCSMWDKSGCDKLLDGTFTDIRNRIPLDQAINIGLGNFARKVLVPVGDKYLNGIKRGRHDRCRMLNSPLHQLIFFRRLAAFLGIPRTRVFFQEPGFTRLENQYLKSCFHENCILDAKVGKPDPSGAQNQLTKKTFLMAPLMFNVLPEIMEPTHRAPGLYVGNKMAKMISSSLPGVEPEDFKEIVAPFARYRRITDAKDLPAFLEGFVWTWTTEIRYLNADKMKAA